MTKSMGQIFEIWFNKKNVGQNVELKKKSKMRKSWPVILSYLSRTAQGYLRQCGLVVHRIHILHTSWGWFQSLLPWGKLGDRIFSNGFRLQLHREVCSSNKLVFFFILMCRSQKIVSTELKASFCPTDRQVPKQEFLLTIIWHWTISCLSESSILCLAIKKGQKKKITIVSNHLRKPKTDKITDQHSCILVFLSPTNWGPTIFRQVTKSFVSWHLSFVRSSYFVKVTNY